MKKVLFKLLATFLICFFACSYGFLTACGKSKSAGAINTFDTAEDAQGCGWKGSKHANKTEWLESYEGKKGVLKMIGAQGSVYRNFYFDASSAWTKDSLHEYITENDGANWDYISVVVWVSSISTNPIENLCMDGYAQTVKVNEWAELQIPKEYFIDGVSTHKKIESMAGNFTDSNEYLFYIRTADNADTSNVMIYVDSISFQKNRDK